MLVYFGVYYTGVQAFESGGLCPKSLIFWVDGLLTQGYLAWIRFKVIQK